MKKLGLVFAYLESRKENIVNFLDMRFKMNKKYIHFLIFNVVILIVIALDINCSSEPFASGPFGPGGLCLPGEPGYPNCMTQSDCRPGDAGYPHCDSWNSWCDDYPNDYICNNDTDTVCEDDPDHPVCGGGSVNFCDEYPDHTFCDEGGDSFCDSNPDHFWCQGEEESDEQCNPYTDEDCEDEEPNWEDGGTTQLTQARGFEDFADFMGLDTDSISHLQVNLLLEQVGEDSKPLYGGDIIIGFYNSYSGFQEVTGEASTTASKIPYNHWVIHDKDNNSHIDKDEHYLKLFFELYGGAMILVANIQNDADELSGVLFFRKHDYKRCSATNTWPHNGCGQAPYFNGYGGKGHCWEFPFAEARSYYEHSGNLYDCRAFTVGSGVSMRVDTKSSIYPTDSNTYVGSYERIGTFSGLGPNAAGVTLPFDSGGICPDNKPFPNYGVKNGQCTPSCAIAGGNASGSQCSDSNYHINIIPAHDVDICCQRTPICPSNKPSPAYGVKNGQCLPSCGTAGGNASESQCSDTRYNINIISQPTYDVDVCCTRTLKQRTP